MSILYFSQEKNKRTKKNILKWKRTDIDSKQSVDIGDANSPDAPWMKDKK